MSEKTNNIKTKAHCLLYNTVWVSVCLSHIRAQRLTGAWECSQADLQGIRPVLASARVETASTGLAPNAEPCIVAVLTKFVHWIGPLKICLQTPPKQPGN